MWLLLCGATFTLGKDTVCVIPMGERPVGPQGEDTALRPPPECSQMSLLSFGMFLLWYSSAKLVLGWDMERVEVASEDVFSA